MTPFFRISETFAPFGAPAASFLPIGTMAGLLNAAGAALADDVDCMLVLRRAGILAAHIDQGLDAARALAAEWRGTSKIMEISDADR